MSNNDSPITPPPELVEEWIAQVWHEGTPVRVGASDIHIATQAARWGSDQELKACVEWLDDNWAPELAVRLRASRRPKPPSLKEQALAEMELLESRGAQACCLGTLRSAIEALPD